MDNRTLKNGFQLATGYQHGLVGIITALHGQSYVEKYGFGKYFECKVASQLAEFVQSYNRDDSEIWSLSKAGDIFGSITIDGSHAHKDGAHLRWFILDPKVKGLGFGHLLLEKAITFCKDRNFPSIYLWTLAGQEPAASLYRKVGFNLEESLMGDQWGRQVEEERLRLRL